MRNEESKFFATWKKLKNRRKKEEKEEGEEGKKEGKKEGRKVKKGGRKGKYNCMSRGRMHNGPQMSMSFNMFLYMAKEILQMWVRIGREGLILHYSGGPDVLTRVLTRGRREDQSDRQWHDKRAEFGVMWSHESRKMGNLRTKLEEARKHIISKASGRKGARLHLDFSSPTLILECRLQGM